EDLDAHDGHQRNDQPGRGLANPRADAVDRVQKALDVHALPPQSAKVVPTIQSTIRSRSPNGALPSERLLRVRPEVVFERHSTIHDGVLLPLRRPLGERELRFRDLLEHRIFRGFLLYDLVVDLKL